MTRLTDGRRHHLQLLQDAQSPEVDSKGWHRKKQGLLGHRCWRMQHSLSSFLLCSKRGCFMNIFRNSLEMYQVLFKSCTLELLCSLSEWFVLCLEVMLRQPGVAFLNLCWHYATLNSTREAGRQCTKQLYKGMSKNESLSSLQETKRLITEELRNRLCWWLTISHPFCFHNPASWFITCVLPCFSRRSIK